MARDGAGTYTRTHADYVYGEVIDQVAINAELNDIATALTGSLTGKFWWGGTAGGTADARTITPSPSISAYAAGQEWVFINGAAANATATPTLAISGLAPRTGKRADGSALVPGDWPANALIRLIDDGTNLRLAERMGGSFAGSIIQAEGAAVASAATTDIWANDGDTVHITGTTTITSFGTAVQAGQWKKVIFDGVLTLTHGANLSLPGSANITTAADDMAFVYADTATQFDVLYFKKNGEATRSFSRSTVASAATTANIWDAGGQIDWTGTVTCTDFPAAPQAGAERILICAGAAPFTAGANMLIDGVTSGNTVTCAANDIMIVRAVTTTQFRLSRVKYDGTAQVDANGLVLLSTVVASASSTVNVETGFGSTYDDYVIIAENINSTTDAIDLQGRLKINGSYQTGSLYYYILDKTASNSSLYSGDSTESVTSFKVATTLDSNGGASSVCNFVMNVYNVNSTGAHKAVDWSGHVVDANAAPWIKKAVGTAVYRASQALTGVQFFGSSGTISGTFRLYGVQK